MSQEQFDRLLKYAGYGVVVAFTIIALTVLAVQFL